MKIKVQGFFDPETFTVSYVVADVASSECAVIDPVMDFDPSSGRTSERSLKPLLDYIAEEKLRLSWILETHAHADHLSGAQLLKRKLGGQVGIGEHICQVQQSFAELFDLGPDFPRDGSQFDQLFTDNQVFQLGRTPVRVLNTPGHTPACVSYLIDDACFVGDTVFMPDYGTARCDFPGGDAATLYRSIHRVLDLPPATRLFMCHDYLPNGRRVAWETTVAAQKAGNKMIHDGIDEATFVRQRQARDAQLGAPRLILPSLQVNIAAGHLPEAHDNGVRYLKIPLNRLGEG